MYIEFYGLSLPPFQVSPDPRFFYQSSVHARALAHLQYGLSQHDGFIIITGEVGAGKTTLVQHLLSALDPARYLTANLVSTQLSATDLIRLVADRLGLADCSASKPVLLREIERMLIERRKQGQRCLLMVDEAQNLPVKALEELRMLSNFQLDSAPLIQSFLLGQPQLRRTLARSDLSQLRQRVIASYHLDAMTESETAEYVLHRLRLANWKVDPELEPGALSEIYKHSEGIPRRINTLCTRLLLYGYLEELHTLDASAVELVAQDLEAEFAKTVATENKRSATRSTGHDGVHRQLNGNGANDHRTSTASAKHEQSMDGPDGPTGVDSPIRDRYDEVIQKLRELIYHLK